MFICVLHNCLIVFLLDFWHFGIECAFTCSPYFLQSFCVLFNYFFLPNFSHLHFLIVLQVLAVLFPRFKRSIVAVIWFFLRSGLEIIIMLGNAIRFVTLLFFVGFFSSFYAFTFCVDCFADFAGLDSSI